MEEKKYLVAEDFVHWIKTIILALGKSQRFYYSFWYIFYWDIFKKCSNFVSFWARKMFFVCLNRSKFHQKSIGFIIRGLVRKFRAQFAIRNIAKLNVSRQSPVWGRGCLNQNYDNADTCLLGCVGLKCWHRTWINMYQKVIFLYTICSRGIKMKAKPL